MYKPNTNVILAKYLTDVMHFQANRRDVLAFAINTFTQVFVDVCPRM